VRGRLCEGDIQFGAGDAARLPQQQRAVWRSDMPQPVGASRAKHGILYRGSAMVDTRRKR